jgi:hypothetical protein
MYGLKDMNFASFSNLNKLKNRFDFGVGQGLTRGMTLLVCTGSGGLGSVAVRSYVIWAAQIAPYPFG